MPSVTELISPIAKLVCTHYIVLQCIIVYCVTSHTPCLPESFLISQCMSTPVKLANCMNPIDKMTKCTTIVR